MEREKGRLESIPWSEIELNETKAKKLEWENKIKGGPKDTQLYGSEENIRLDGRKNRCLGGLRGKEGYTNELCKYKKLAQAGLSSEINSLRESAVN